MNRAELKAKAKERIRGKIGILFAIYLLVLVAVGVLSSFTGGLATLLIAGGISLSFATIFLAIFNKNKEPEVSDIFIGFKDNNFGRGFVGYILFEVFVLLWTLLFIIPGIVKSFSYSQLFYIMADDKKISASDALKKSIEMMKGHKAELFVLYLSFIPWILLGCITFGLAYIWVGPYMEATLAGYYEYLKKAK